MLKDPKFFEKNKPYLVSMVEEYDIESIIGNFKSSAVEGSQAFSYSLIVSGQEKGSNMSPYLYNLLDSNIAICVDPNLVEIHHAETQARATFGIIPKYQKHELSTFSGKMTTSRPEIKTESGEEERIADLSRWNPLDKEYTTEDSQDLHQTAANLLYQHYVKGARGYNELLVTAKKDAPSPVSGIIITNNDSNALDESEFNPDIIKGLLESHPNLKLYLYSPEAANSMVECDREIAIAVLSDVKGIKDEDGKITFDQFKEKYSEIEKGRSTTKSGRERHNPPSSASMSPIAQQLQKTFQELNGQSRS